MLLSIQRIAGPALALVVILSLSLSLEDLEGLHFRSVHNCRKTKAIHSVESEAPGNTQASAAPASDFEAQVIIRAATAAEQRQQKIDQSRAARKAVAAVLKGPQGHKVKKVIQSGVTRPNQQNTLICLEFMFEGRLFQVLNSRAHQWAPKPSGNQVSLWGSRIPGGPVCVDLSSGRLPELYVTSAGLSCKHSSA